MRIWMIASEMAPFSKTGGLGDVVGALPSALARLGCEVTVVVPYTPAMAASAEITPAGVGVEALVDGVWRWAQVLEARLAGGVRVLFIDYPPYFQRDGLYGTPHGDHADNAQRFAFFSYAAIEAAKIAAPGPDVVHAHDWQGGLVPLLVRAPEHYGDDPRVAGAFTVHTIHNLSYQGLFPKEVLPSLGISWAHFHWRELEFFDSVNFLKAGLTSADLVTTVSPTYAREILEPAQGWGLEGVLRERSAQGALIGILNGIDTRHWDPARDGYIPSPFEASTLGRRGYNSAALREELGLEPSGEPIVGLVTRLAEQKGIDLLLGLGDQLGDLGLQWAILGNGDHRYETAVSELAQANPGRVAVRIGFDERLAHLIYGGSDFFCMPSLFEPCGLGQLIALRYGCLPVVRETGGLADTVRDLAESGGVGIVFQEGSPGALLEALGRAAELAQRPDLLRKARETAMGLDHSWEHSAREYLRVFRREGLSVPDVPVAARPPAAARSLGR